MSRIGKNIITVPKEVKVKITDHQISVAGQKGKQSWLVHKNIEIKMKDDSIQLTRLDDSAISRALHGTTRQLVNNMIIGVSAGFKKDLEIVGVGYQASIQGNRLLLQLGFSHDIYFDLPEGINVTADRTTITVEGIDKQLVGSVAAKIRSFRPPEPYKGKGVRYKDEYVRSKQGKTVGE